MEGDRLWIGHMTRLGSMSAFIGTDIPTDGSWSRKTVSDLLPLVSTPASPLIDCVVTASHPSNLPPFSSLLSPLPFSPTLSPSLVLCPHSLSLPCHSNAAGYLFESKGWSPCEMMVSEENGRQILVDQSTSKVPHLNLVISVVHFSWK